MPSILPALLRRQVRLRVPAVTHQKHGVTGPLQHSEPHGLIHPTPKCNARGDGEPCHGDWSQSLAHSNIHSCAAGSLFPTSSVFAMGTADRVPLPDRRSNNTLDQSQTGNANSNEQNKNTLRHLVRTENVQLARIFFRRF